MPDSGFATGTEYPFPTGDSPVGANCLSECEYRFPVSYSDQLDRDVGLAPVDATRRGVSGLYNIGANVWERVDGGKGDQKVTARGWWYEAFRMHRNDRTTKPRKTAIIYVGFRCAKDMD